MIVKNKAVIKLLPFEDYIFLVYVFCLTCGYGRLTNYLSAGLSIIVFLLCYRSIVKTAEIYKKTFLCFLLFFIFHFLTSIINAIDLYDLIGTQTMGIFARFIPICVFAKVSNYDYWRKYAFYKSLTALWFVIVIVSTITFINTDGGGRVYTNSNFGSLLGGAYAAAYCSVLVAIIFLQIVLDKDFNKVKIVYFIGFILSCMHVVTTNSMITTIALLVGCILSVFYHGNLKANNRTKIVTIFIILLSVVLISQLSEIGIRLIKISEQVNNPTYAQRIKEIGLYMYSNDETYHVGKRISVVLISLETFMKYPLFGVGYKVGNHYALLYGLVGHHSQLLDCLAQYGIIGSIPLFGVYFNSFKTMFKATNLNIRVPILFAFFVMFLFNPFISDQTNYIIFLYIPLALCLHEEKKTV